MAHPDKTRGGSEKGQRQHAGKTSRRSDAGMQADSQHGQRGGEATAASGGMRGPQDDDRRDSAEREAEELSRGSSDGTPPLKGKTSKMAGRGGK